MTGLARLVPPLVLALLLAVAPGLSQSVPVHASPAGASMQVSGLPGGGNAPASVVDVPSCVSFLTGGGLAADGSSAVCQQTDNLTQLFGGSKTFNQVFSCMYAQAQNIVSGGGLDRDMLASCLGLPSS